MMKKLLSVMLALMLIVGTLAFTSCESVESTLEKADKALAEKPYTVTMDMDFECDDATLNAIFDALSMEIPLTVDGDNVSLDMEMDVMGQSVGMKMLVVDKVLYSSVDLGITQTKMKATLDDTQLKEFMDENATTMPVDYLQFEELKMEKKDDKQVITCSGITTEGLSELNKTMSESLEALGAEAAAGDISFEITLKDGKYDTMTMTCSYSVTIEGKTYTVGMTTNATYAYKDVAKITAPTDADSYQDVSYDQIVGG